MVGGGQLVGCLCMKRKHLDLKVAVLEPEAAALRLQAADLHIQTGLR